MDLYLYCVCLGVCPDQAAAWEVLTRRHRQLVSSLIPQDKLDSAELGLVSTKGITDAAFKHLPQRHPLLKRLELGHTSITDVGVGYLQPCRNLKTLHLNHTDITNVALQHL